jgi:putative acetyltransferase
MIRRAVTSDASSLPALHRASIFRLCRGDYSAEQLDEWTSGFHPRLYEKLARTHVMFVFEEHESLLGFAVCDPAAGLINAVYVHPDAVGRGIGRLLMAALETDLRDYGVQRIQLNATVNAREFYDSLGYSRHGPTVNRLPSGSELPCEQMSKLLMPTR